jgi:hypothetical protein
LRRVGVEILRRLEAKLQPVGETLRVLLTRKNCVIWRDVEQGSSIGRYTWRSKRRSEK